MPAFCAPVVRPDRTNPFEEITVPPPRLLPKILVWRSLSPSRYRRRVSLKTVEKQNFLSISPIPSAGPKTQVHSTQARPVCGGVIGFWHEQFLYVCVLGQKPPYASPERCCFCFVRSTFVSGGAAATTTSHLSLSPHLHRMG